MEDDLLEESECDMEESNSHVPCDQDTSQLPQPNVDISRSDLSPENHCRPDPEPPFHPASAHGSPLASSLQLRRSTRQRGPSHIFTYPSLGQPAFHPHPTVSAVTIQLPVYPFLYYPFAYSPIPLNPYTYLPHAPLTPCF